MEWFWIVQVAFNVAMISVLVWMHRARHNVDDDQAKATACVNVLQSRVQECEEKLRLYEKQMQLQLQRLLKVCEKAEQVIEQSRVPTINLASTEEQKELIAAVNSADAQIPSLNEIEQTRRRLSKESPVDLRTLLTQQLA